MSRICYSSMKHVEGDVVNPRDCILVASGNRKKDLPFVAKVTALWENPDDGKYHINGRFQTIITQPYIAKSRHQHAETFLFMNRLAS